MINPNDPNDPNEVERLAALHRYGVLDTPAEEAFDRITRLAQSALRVPIVLVSLIDENRQWFKSKQGLDTPETARDISFCTHAIQQNEPLIITDALEDSRFRSNPLVTGAPNIRFYVGVPLRTPDGHNIGTLCAIDQKPRELTDDHIHILRDLASLVMDELELRRLAANAA
ncbi:MAG: GAF domain-containing protein [Alphaproteobacteria bacterium]|nr:GAF domain-containing protein [Alphaproteobacteria bacterium]